MSVEIIEVLQSLDLAEHKKEYRCLEKDTMDIIYPEDEALPLVAVGPVQKAFRERRIIRDTILNRALQERNS